MTKDEALKLALEALEKLNNTNSYWWQEVDEEIVEKIKPAITAIKEALAQHDSVQAKPEPEHDNTYIYASSLATAIWQKYYMKESPKFALLDTTEGVLTQIDNMACGLVREKPEQPEQEPVLWMMPDGKTVDKWGLQFYSSDVGTPLYTTPPQRKPLTWERMLEIGTECANDKSRLPFEVKIARRVEAAHGIKE